MFLVLVLGLRSYSATTMSIGEISCTGKGPSEPILNRGLSPVLPVANEEDDFVACSGEDLRGARSSLIAESEKGIKSPGQIALEQSLPNL